MPQEHRRQPRSVSLQTIPQFRPFGPVVMPGDAVWAVDNRPTTSGESQEERQVLAGAARGSGPEHWVESAETQHRGSAPQRASAGPEAPRRKGIERILFSELGTEQAPRGTLAESLHCLEYLLRRGVQPPRQDQAGGAVDAV